MKIHNFILHRKLGLVVYEWVIKKRDGEKTTFIPNQKKIADKSCHLNCLTKKIIKFLY